MHPSLSHDMAQAGLSRYAPSDPWIRAIPGATQAVQPAVAGDNPVAEPAPPAA